MGGLGFNFCPKPNPTVTLVRNVRNLIISRLHVDKIREVVIDAQTMTKLDYTHVQHANRKRLARIFLSNASIAINHTQQMIEIASIFESY